MQYNKSTKVEVYISFVSSSSKN